MKPGKITLEDLRIIGAIKVKPLRIQMPPPSRLRSAVIIDLLLAVLILSAILVALGNVIFYLALGK